MDHMTLQTQPNHKLILMEATSQHKSLVYE
jgi:hypothetical protein